MTSSLKTTLTAQMETAARQAGLARVSTTEGTDFHGAPTAVFELALKTDAGAARNLRLELSEHFDFNKPDLLPAMTAHVAEEAKRLRNPRPDAYVTLEGLPVSLKNFRWPFHRSTSGADTYIVHGEIHLEDGTASPLHAKVSAAMTVTTDSGGGSCWSCVLRTGWPLVCWFFLLVCPKGSWYSMYPPGSK